MKKKGKKKESWLFEDICPSKMLLCACTFSNVFSLKLTTSEISYAFLKQMHIILPLLTWNYRICIHVNNEFHAIFNN